MKYIPSFFIVEYSEQKWNRSNIILYSKLHIDIIVDT